MKNIRILLAVLAIAAGSAMAQAGGLFKFGPKVGMTVNSINLKSDDGNNKTGWTAGLMTEFRVPIIGIGADLSAMYVRRNAKYMLQNGISKDNRDYIEIPLNLRYNFSLPVVGKFVAPYLGVGPSVSFLTGKNNVKDAFYNKSVDWALNFGIGVQLVSHVDISARYGLGLTKAVKTLYPSAAGEPAGIQGKNRYWTVSVAYLF